MASTSSQPPSSTPTGWDVFLSFRGEDTRNNFTSHLYFALVDSGIQTFKDEPELRSGDDISDALRLAIQESKAYIVVFSENYASSAWCLSELEEIFNCNQTMGRLVIPVFYNIKPGIVRYQTGTFKQAFEKHESRFAAEMVKDGRNERIKVWFERVKDWRQRVEGWRRSLKQVANKAGKEIDGNKSEAYIIKEIVDELLRKINLNTLKVPKYPVGLHSRVEAITTLLSSDTKGVIKFGIYGMGGVGKTTLAKALFNQLLGGRNFKGSCFLADVRENAKTAKGLVSLQEQLLNDVLNTTKKVEVKNVDQGINYIRERISSAKVLALIDDIYEPEQYENLAGSFASGSVVIITTRDEEMLDKVDVEPKYRYMLKELDDDQSRELFTKYAFEKAEPSNNLLALTEDILRLAGGLPLALQVFGSHLSTKKEVGWKSYIANLQKYPNSTIEEKLVISLDALELDDRVLKKIFIDIACFFIGWEKEGAVEVLETYYSYTDDKMDILKKRCLLTVNDRNILEMHDLLRDVGRNVARNNAPDEPGKHSRLWLPKDIGDVLKNHNGTEVIEGIIPYNIYDKDVVQEDSSSSSCDICHKHVFKGESFTTETFKWMSKLRYLYLSNVNLTGSFEHIFEDLRVFYWDRCPLKCLPSDFCPKKLVILELPSSNMRTMWDLNMVSHAFGKLKTLNMSGSYNLTETPDFTKLPCLETLNLQFCPSLEEVHISIGSLGRLVSLNLLDCKKLRSLPDSICSLRALEVLNISQCSSLEALPIQLGNIESLTKLDARVLPVSELPDSIGHLTKLVELDLSCNQKLETLPDTICNLRSLKVLNIFYCGLDAFPTAIANIESLTKLNASCLTVSKLPDSIGSLTKLVELDLSYNKKLETLPDTICNLRSLEVLNINGCLELERLPDQLWKLTRLRELDACGDTRLRRLPDIEPSQIALSLQELRLNSRDITALPSGFTQLSNLQILDLNHCRSLLSIPKLPPSLESIRAKECSSLERLPDLSNLKQLEELDLDGCRKLTDIPSFPPNLKTIRANRCSSLERLPDLSNLKQLEGLHLDYCRKLTDIPSFPPNLKTIWAYDCSSLERLPDLSNLKQLKVLVLDYCRKLTDIASFPPNLKTIWANGCSSLERLPDLSNLKQLEELDLYGCENLTDIQGLEQLTALKFNLTNLEKFNLRKQLSEICLLQCHCKKNG